jgi:demethylmenaquinone methyltransferase/2-methoxy-6-polyprenyl-1,4-benzoquinol methylase
MELDFIKGMFDTIAPRYDFLNRLLSLRQDVYWRRIMIAALKLPENATALDAACGTGDVIVELLNQNRPPRMAAGVDFSREMLTIARAKIARENLAHRVHLTAGNALQLPFAENTFDAVTIAFGIRNIMHRKAALTCFRACLKPGGKVAVLELATPGNKLLSRLYLLYFQRILPRIGALFSRQIKAYTYLPASVLHFPAPEKFAKIMKQAGFISIRWRRLTFGVATVYIGEKPILHNKINKKIN